MTNIYFKSSPIRNSFQSERSFRQKKKSNNSGSELLSFDISPIYIMSFLMLAIACLSVLYLISFNQVATKGYELKRLEVSRQELKQQSDLKTLYLAKVKSMDHILASNYLSPMRKPGSVEFVSADSFLAKAD
ncbi:hypothetical protein GF376_03070 [Candidatus Peregrinibacteria bacterium]|nr:hypothetical protein [Candidatus Peregrinibacteria bacterium]